MSVTHNSSTAHGPVAFGVQSARRRDDAAATRHDAQSSTSDTRISFARLQLKTKAAAENALQASITGEVGSDIAVPNVHAGCFGLSTSSMKTAYHKANRQLAFRENTVVDMADRDHPVTTIRLLRDNHIVTGAGDGSIVQWSRHTESERKAKWRPDGSFERRSAIESLDIWSTYDHGDVVTSPADPNRKLAGLVRDVSAPLWFCSFAHEDKVEVWNIKDEGKV